MSKQKKEKPKQVPTIAPGIENDELDTKATEEEIERGESTEVTKLFIDRID